MGFWSGVFGTAGKIGDGIAKVGTDIWYTLTGNPDAPTQVYPGDFEPDGDSGVLPGLPDYPDTPDLTDVTDPVVEYITNIVFPVGFETLVAIFVGVVVIYFFVRLFRS